MNNSYSFYKMQTVCSAVIRVFWNVCELLRFSFGQYYKAVKCTNLSFVNGLPILKSYNLFWIGICFHYILCFAIPIESIKSRIFLCVYIYILGRYIIIMCLQEYGTRFLYIYHRFLWIILYTPCTTYNTLTSNPLLIYWFLTIWYYFIIYHIMTCLHLVYLYLYLYIYIAHWPIFSRESMWLIITRRSV